MLQKITEADLQEVEQFVRESLTDMFDTAQRKMCITANETELQKRWFFGGFSSDPSKFMFLPDEKVSIQSISSCVEKIFKNHDEFQLDKPDEKKLFKSVFGLVFGHEVNHCFASFNTHTSIQSISEKGEKPTKAAQHIVALQC